VTVSGEDSVSGVCVSAAESTGAEEHCSPAEPTPTAQDPLQCS
jgi:hypothetical protein